MGKVVKLPKKKKTYQVHLRTQVVTYMLIEAENQKEAHRLAVLEMPSEFSIDSFDSELEEIINAEISIVDVE